MFNYLSTQLGCSPRYESECLQRRVGESHLVQGKTARFICYTIAHFLKERFLGDQEIIENLIVSIIYTQVYHWILEKMIYYSIMQQIKFAGQFIDLNEAGTFESDRLGFRLDFLFR